MLISSAWAHELVHAETAGGGTALLIILVAIIGLYFGYRARNKWRKCNLQRDSGAE